MLKYATTFPVAEKANACATNRSVQIARAHQINIKTEEVGG